MRQILLALTLLTVPFIAKSQSNVIKAIVISNTGDSIYGSIDYRNWKNNPRTIDFFDASNKKQTYDAGTIRGFYVPSVNEVYSSFTVKMDMLPGDQDDAIRNNITDTSAATRTVFLLQLIRHPHISLFEFSDKNKDHFFYKKTNEQPVELIHNYVYDEQSKQVNENFKYRDQLANLFSGCQNAVNDAKAMRFRKKEIENVFVKYLQCADPNMVVNVKKEDPVTFKFGIVGGVMSNTFNFEGNTTLAAENYKGNVSPLFGVSLDLTLPRNRHKWHIVNEVIYKTYKTGTSFTRPFNIRYRVTSDVAVQFSYAQLNTLVRYYFQSNSLIRTYINAGIGNAFIVSENKNNVHNSYSFGREEDIKAFDGPNKYEFSWQGGIGLLVRKFGVEFRHGQSKKGFSPQHELDVNPKSIQGILTFQF
jgi:hypothetical protein